jgi:hypothetical protein
MAEIFQDQSRSRSAPLPGASCRRLWLLRLITLAIASTISVILVEMIVRVSRLHSMIEPVASAGDMTEVYEFSRARHHRLVPNARYRHVEVEFDYIWSNNSLGMRDQERTIPKDSGTFRILFMGDSLVQGYGVSQEQTMVALLEASLNEPKREKRVEVLNAGIFGYGPFLEYLYLQEIMPWVEPDIVVVGFFLGNDVGDDYFYTQQASLNNYGKPSFANLNWPWTYKDEFLKNGTENAKSDSKKYAQAWMLKSHLIRLFLKVQERKKTYEQYRDYRRREAQFIRERKDDIRVNLGAINYAATDQRRRLEYWEISKSYLKHMHGLCRGRGVPMVLAIIPVLETDIGQFNEFDEPNQIMKELGKELSIPVVFLINEFRKWSAEELLFELDGHWNALGNRVAARVMDWELRRLDLLPDLLHK